MATDARLLKLILRHPLSIAAAMIVVGVEVAFVKWFQPGVLMLGASALLGIGLLALWPTMAIRSPFFMKKAFAASTTGTEDREKDLATLADDLQRVGSHQGVEQLNQLRAKLDGFSQVLEHRMSAGEVTFGRYMGMAEQVFLVAIDNLQEIAVTLTSVGTIDRDYLDDRLAELRGDGATDEHVRSVEESLEQRRSLHEQQLKKVAELFAQNEAAMTALTNTSVALAETRMGKGRASLDAQEAMAELEQLAKRVGSYSAARS